MTNVLPVAIVTGASRGIGKSIVNRLSREGISCIAIASSKKSIEGIKLDDPLMLIHEKQRHRSLAIDLSQWPQWTASEKHFGIDYHENKSGYFPLYDMWKDSDTIYQPTLLVNCAGITQQSLSVRTDVDTITKLMNVNFMSSVSLTNMTLKQMIKNRKRTRADTRTNRPCIINICSVLATSDLTVPGTSVYAASKAALSQYTKVVAQEVNPCNIAIVSISPGLVPATDMLKGLECDGQSHLQKLASTFGTCTPEQIASQVWDIYNSTE
ncbi:hypothetical protein HG535_0C05420 [Zygotorulaspora mrakii]|uniref:3-oxoacyl-[acyl-carrier-protein] reductase n=1 Tax=Zygotorulaspora mrakii TaxID=42260 RepID=A0A7H9B0M6_ZYGMR|nr:uncharacterized protein HG535_0C05420 [Zygotorulaspora mrakii]QLG72188.1 hypothetical protein HG535_0C05420 [Zygotorulaspora mrakii]